MTTEQQDTLWACLPKEVREEKRKEYRIVSKNPRLDRGDSIYLTALDNIFGHHNLTSDTEPAELLFVERKKVQKLYSQLQDRYKEIKTKTIPKNIGQGHDYVVSERGFVNGAINELKLLFGDKCLPDKIQDTGFGGMNLTPPACKLDVKPEQPSVQDEPKFRKGDKVCFKDSYYKEELHGKVGIIAFVNAEAECYVEVDNTIYCSLESDLEPYTEPETKDMEEKALKKPLPPPRPKTNHQEFVDRANIIHNNKYKYPDEYAGSNKKLRIICPIHGEFWQTPNSHLKGHGCWKCSSQRNTHLICGVGENDAVFAKETKIRNIWYQMLNRCYNESVRSKYPTYEDCSVHEDWHKFSNFLKWYKSNNPHGFELDKDILYKGNKIYGPDTCCCLPKSINVLIRPMEKRNSVIPTKDGKYRVVCKITDGFKKFRGVFNSFEEALSVAKHIRRAKIAELAILYFNQGKINKQVFIALLNYDFN